MGELEERLDFAERLLAQEKGRSLTAGSSRMKKWLGIDFVDFLIQAGITVSAMAFVGVGNGPDELMPVIFGISLVILGVRRQVALESARRRFRARRPLRGWRNWRPGCWRWTSCTTGCWSWRSGWISPNVC